MLFNSVLIWAVLILSSDRFNSKGEFFSDFDDGLDYCSFAREIEVWIWFFLILLDFFLFILLLTVNVHKLLFIKKLYLPDKLKKLFSSLKSYFISLKFQAIKFKDFWNIIWTCKIWHCSREHDSSKLNLFKNYCNIIWSSINVIGLANFLEVYIIFFSDIVVKSTFFSQWVSQHCNHMHV